MHGEKPTAAAGFRRLIGESMKQAYTKINFRKSTREMLAKIDEIASEYAAQGISMTVRQAYYQLVARGVIPNTPQEYRKIAATISDGRKAGILDWDYIEDRTRSEKALTHWESPEEILLSAANSYRTDTRRNQPCYLEAWIEKDALIGIVKDVAWESDVTCFSCRGYPSVTAVREAASRFQRQARRRVILYAGDHDPTGLDIPRDISEKMEMFGASVEVVRIGLTDEQIRRYNPPPCPVKESDKRSGKYVKQYGNQCWELDALPPDVLAGLFREHIAALTDPELLQAARRDDEQTRRGLRNLVMTEFSREWS